MTHNFGSWHVGQGNGEGCVFADEGRMRCEELGTTLYPICQVIDYDGEADANARLIAAAPDLLEACKSALYSLTCYTESDRKQGIETPTLDELRNAIAKATGNDVQ